MPFWTTVTQYDPAAKSLRTKATQDCYYLIVVDSNQTVSRRSELI